MSYQNSNPRSRQIRWSLTAFGCALFAASACAQGIMVVGNGVSHPTRTVNGDGVEIFSGGNADKPGPGAGPMAASAPVDAVGSSPGNRSPAQRADAVSKQPRGEILSLVSPRLTAAPGQAAVVRVVDPRRTASQALVDGRVEILLQELTKEGQDLLNKQRLLRLPAGRDPLADELRERVKAEVRQHEQNIAGLNREIERVVQEQRRAHAKLSSDSSLN